MITCPYRAVPGRSFWSSLHALMMNTEFLSGCLTARMLEGMKFALGPTIATRKDVLNEIGGLESIKDYCAEDFVMGNLVAARGHRVVFSSYVIDHYIGAQTFPGDYRNRIRWVRSTRRSRPAGYVGQFFTYPIPIALLLFVVHPAAWPLVTTLAFRFALAFLTGWVILRDPLTLRRFFLIPVQDVVSFLYWLAGFFGNTIAWHGDTFYLTRDGKYQRRGR
jgi:ceramide glucosyltransferase